MVEILLASPRFALQPSVTNRPFFPLWTALNGCLLDLRMPLYNRRLGKRPAKPIAVDLAIQRGLTVMAAFVEALGLSDGQAIMSSTDGWIKSISFQPRPFGLNWTAQHAIDPPEAVLAAQSRNDYVVDVEDLLHLAAKLVYAICGYNAGVIPDLTATMGFSRADDRVGITVVAREMDSQTVYRFDLT
jgi:hypothetical protein